MLLFLLGKFNPKQEFSWHFAYSFPQNFSSFSELRLQFGKSYPYFNCFRYVSCGLGEQVFSLLLVILGVIH